LNFPNPFNPRTIIPITVIKKESFSINIYDSNGRLVNEIFNGTLNPGNFSYSWNGKNNNNIICAAGIYFCRIVKNNKIIHTKKMILLK